MSENPYQSPATIDLVATPETQHRSFRLTVGPANKRAGFKVGTIRQAVLFALIQQIPFLAFMSLVLDGGSIFKIAAVASIAFWTWTVIIVVRSRESYSESDVLVIKWGYLPMFLIAYNAWLMIAAVSG